MDSLRYKLNSGSTMPTIGAGTWQLAEGAETEEAVSAALKAGYRLVDTAKIYGNERSVGKAVANSGVPRKEIFVTTKMWPSDFGYETGLVAFDASLERLGLQYLDLYLLHWPNGPERADAWRAMEEIYQQGRSKAVGVSNYSAEQIDEVAKQSKLVPSVNQIEFHPFIYQKQKPVLDKCAQRDIVVEAYSPLTVGRNISHPQITKVSKEYGKSNAQVILRWCIQHGTVPIPRSTNPKHIKENMDIFDFELSKEHMEQINSLGSGDSWKANTM